MNKTPEITLLELVNHIFVSHPQLRASVTQLATTQDTQSNSKTASNPLNVSEEQARLFFEKMSSINSRLIASLKPYLAEARIVFDVGANAGYFSKALTDVGFSGTLVLFEPIPNLLSLAVKTLSTYLNPKVFVCAALGDHDGVTEISLPEDGNIGWITLVQEKSNSLSVARIIIEDTKKYALKYRPDIVKIDVEGYEAFILEPFLAVLSAEYRPVFLVEIGWGLSNPNWTSFSTLVPRFSELGYRFYEALNPDHELSTTALLNTSRTTDILFVPH